MVNPLELTLMALIVPALCLAATSAQAEGGSDHRPAWNNAELAGQPVDISPWAYAWRADHTVQDQPEACFIPHRLERIDSVYRTAIDALPPEELKSIYYDQPDILKRLPPPPKGALQAGLLWTGGLVDYEVRLEWPEGADAPDPATVEVRVYPTAFGWFGWAVDKILTDPVLSEDGRTWTYRSDPAEVMDTSYSRKVPAATEMVAVFCEGEAPVPEMRASGPSTGTWERMDIEMEWGFEPGTEDESLDGRLDAPCAVQPARATASGLIPADHRGESYWVIPTPVDCIWDDLTYAAANHAPELTAKDWVQMDVLRMLFELVEAQTVGTGAHVPHWCETATHAGERGRQHR